MRVAEKWDGRMPRRRRRARQLEGARPARRGRGRRARAQAVSIQLQSDARLKEMTESTGWRLTEPLRRVNAVRRRLRRRAG